MKLNRKLYFVILLIIGSCNVDSKKNNVDPELDKAVLELKQMGGFEETNYEFLGKSNVESVNQIIKVEFSNTHISNLDEEEFGKTSAQKIYNLNEKTRTLETIWISIIDGNMKDAKVNSDSNISLNTTRNLIYKSSDLK